MAQDFTQSIRAIFFDTGLEEFRYATHGGTLFVAEYGGEVFGITCRHVFKDFEPGRLFVGPNRTPEKGHPPARLKTITFPNNPKGETKESDVLDMAILRFEGEITPDFFGGTAYKIDETSVAQSREGTWLKVFGVLKSRTRIEPPNVYMDFCDLDFQDVGGTSSDVSLREARGEWLGSVIDDITGISGSPVFNQDLGALCGMVVRGGMQDKKCAIRYIDIFDIAHFLDSVSKGAATTTYEKVPERAVFGERPKEGR